MEPLPRAVCIGVGASLANDLYRAVMKLTPYEDKALYDVGLQGRIRESMRLSTPVGFDSLVEEIRIRLIKPPYFAYIYGLRFDEANLLFVGLTSAFGDAIDPYQQSWSRLVRYIRPSTDRSVEGRGVLNENFHTDGTDWPRPNDLTCLLCVRPDQNGGGRSRLMDLPTVISEMERCIGKNTIAVLNDETLPWKVAEELGGGIIRSAILSMGEMRWLHYTIVSAVECGLAQISDTTSNVLRAIDEVLASTPAGIEFLAEPSALIVINNKRCLHARGAIPAPESSERLVLRTKIQRKDAVSAADLPASWQY
jgi:hypothetical protein